MKKLAIIIRDDNYARLLVPLSFAHGFAEKGSQLDVLFLNWALWLLTPDGVQSACIDGRHASEEIWLRERLASGGNPVEFWDFLKLLKQTGQVTLNGCSLSAEILGIRAEDLIPEADGLVDSKEFVETAAREADHCQYF
jgi:peroxiredoxin family protein